MINLTHYDLDGVVCSILLKSFIDKIEIISTGYNRLNDIFKKVLKQDENLIITDLSLDEGQVNQFLNIRNKVLYIDHHESSRPLSNNFMIDRRQTTIVHNVKFCASANLMKFFKEKGQQFSARLNQLVYFTNDYDMWSLKEETSKKLNFIFWKIGFDKFLEMFKDGFDQKLVDQFELDYQRHNKDIKGYLLNCQTDEVEFEGGVKCLIIFATKHINEVTIEYPNYDFYFIISNTRKISLRCNKPFDLIASCKYLSQMDCIESCGFHKHAGGVEIKPSYTLEDCLPEIIEYIYNEALIPF